MSAPGYDGLTIATVSGATDAPGAMERTRLLSGRQDHGYLTTDVGPVKVDPSAKSEARLVAEEARTLAVSSVPVIASYMLQNSFQTVSIVIVGWGYPEGLSVAAFAYMFSTCTGWLIGMGGTTALDTLASAAYMGSDKAYTGILLQRAVLVLTLFYLPVAVVWIFSDRLFLALGQDATVARDACRFLTHLIPGALGYIYFEIVKKYLQAQGILNAGTYVLLITSPLSALLNYLFIHKAGMGVMGAPIATGIGYWLSLAGLVLYAKYVQGSACWAGWDRRCLQNLGVFARIAFLGFIHLGTEFWAFEIVALVAGRLGNLSLASQSILMTADQVLVTIPFGIGVATSVRVGNALGLRDKTAAQRSANTALLLSVCVAACLMAMLFATRYKLAGLLTPDAEVIRYTADVIPLVAVFQIFDGLNGSSGGALRGLGKQHIGAAANLGSYYVVALPLGSWLAFAGWELSGLWAGQLVGMFLAATIEVRSLLRVDWDTEIELAFERISA
ncbi:ethionine resistance protein [Sporothrix stenoceras]|uniref:Ethionine resistance protein n=1 Tax=Sporothrix stenoceras TaxID=5173 RepID=A0ABR3YH52_9PEZI